MKSYPHGCSDQSLVDMTVNILHYLLKIIYNTVLSHS